MEHRSEQSLRQDYAVQVAAEKNRYHKRRIQYEQNILNNVLPSRNGAFRTGTSYIQRYMTRPDHTGISHHVGDCLADIVDVVDGVVNGMIRLDHFQETFVPPPNNYGIDPVTGESILQRQQRIEKDLRQDIEELSHKLRTSELARSNQWKKMLKTKCDYSIPHDISMGGGPPRNVKLDYNTASNVPVPALRQTSTQNLYQNSNTLLSNTTMGSYKPAARRNPAPRRPVPKPKPATIPTPVMDSVSVMSNQIRTSTSFDNETPLSPSATADGESKYSAARVKERIAADGSVQPVSEPKKSKDGLYLRPAGRTRKGMDWDAVRGIWIPMDGSPNS